MTNAFVVKEAEVDFITALRRSFSPPQSEVEATTNWVQAFCAGCGRRPFRNRGASV